MKPHRAKSKVIAVVLLAGVLPFLASLAAHLIIGDAKHVQEPLHEGFELAGCCIALGVAMILLLRLWHENASSHLFWVVAALVAMGIVDGMHSFLPTGVAFSWTRHGATLVGGAFFALVWLPLPVVVVRRKEHFIFLVAVLAIAGSLAILWWPERLPAPWVAGDYSRSVIATNALGGLGFLAAAVFFIRRYLREPQGENLVFASHTLLFGTASLLFGFSHVWGADWWVWHGARLLAYAIVLATAQKTVVALYQHLARSAQELLKANEDLRTEIVERQRVVVEVARQSEEQVRLNAALTRSNRTTLNLMQDAVQAKDRLEKVNQELQLEIAERKRKEEALKESEKKFRSMAETSPLAIYMSTGIEQKAYYINPMFVQLFGYTIEDVPTMGHWWPRAYPDEKYRQQISEEWQDKVKRAIETKTPIEPVDVTVTCKDGSTKNVMWGFTFLGDTNFAFGIDITERKKAEEQKAMALYLQRKTELLEISNKELEAFSYSVSHDLRAPLRSIDGFSKALLEDYSAKLDEQGRNYLGRVRTACQQMAQLIEDMLMLSKINRSEMRRNEVDLSALAKSIADEFMQNEPQRKVEFVIAPSITANGDEQLLNIMLHNLLENAWKFTGKHPSARIEFGVTKNEETTYFVADDGAGFDMKYADKLFGAFQRLHTLEEFEGTGIGLAVVQRVVSRHGGKVWAQGEVEKGATIYFTLV